MGKTTTSIHIAVYLAAKRGAGCVTLGDTDVNRSALSWSDHGGERVPFLVTDGDNVPRFDFDADEDPEWALAIEVTENEKRRDYLLTEVKNLAERLKAAGYWEGRGKPKKG